MAIVVTEIAESEITNTNDDDFSILVDYHDNKLPFRLSITYNERWVDTKELEELVEALQLALDKFNEKQ